MKKLFAAALFFIFIFLFSVSCYSSDGYKLYYNGTVYDAGNMIVATEDGYFFEVSQLAPVLRFTYTLDPDSQNLIVRFGKTLKECDLVFIDGRLCLTPDFIANGLGMTIRRDKNNNTVYILPSDKADAGMMQVFTNITYGYSLTLDSNTIIDFGKTGDDFQERLLTVKEKNGLYTATITCDRLDEPSMEILRKYYGSDALTDEELFKRFCDYKKSYHAAMQEYYNISMLYGSSDSTMPETSMKIFGRHQTKLFGQDSEIIIYNVIPSEKADSKEEVHIDIQIPFSKNKTIYSFNFTIEKDSLTKETLIKIKKLIRSVHISGFSEKSGFLDTPEISAAIQAASLGIYPGAASENEAYNELVDSISGYRLSYPFTYTPYLQNNLMSEYSYKSFKIDRNNFFSVAVEPIYDTEKAVTGKIQLLKELNSGSIRINSEGEARVGKNLFYRIGYELGVEDNTVFIEDYFITSGSKLYNIQLKSRFIKPSADVLESFLKILSSLELIPPATAQEQRLEQSVNFMNIAEGYTFSYPGDWQFEEVSQDVNYDQYSVKFHHLSGQIDISVSEGEFDGEIAVADILKCITGLDEKGLDQHFKEYKAPYIGRPSRVLMTSYYTEGDNIYLYKLINYLDSNNRGRLCYSRDIVRGKKIYTMSVSVADYASNEGKISNESLNSALNFITGSFKLEDTAEYVVRMITGETRNKKVIFIEDFFKQQFGMAAYVVSTQSLGSSSDVLVNLEGTDERGFYRIKLDYEGKRVEIIDTVLKSQIMDKCSELIGDLFGSSAQITFPSRNTFLLDSQRQSGGSFYYTPVYVEGNSLPGYALLKVNPLSGDVEFESYKSVEELYSDVTELYQVPFDGFRMVSCRIDDEDKFNILVFSISENGNAFRINRLDIRNTGRILVPYKR